MCSPTPPPAPNYSLAADQTAASNLDFARQTAQANRPDEISPLGTRTWQQGGDSVFDQEGYDAALEGYQTQQDVLSGLGNVGRSAYLAQNEEIFSPTRQEYTTISGDPDQWTSTVSLSPEVQSLFDKELENKGRQADLSLSGLNSVEDIFKTPFSTTGQVGEYAGPNYAGIEGDVPQYQGGDYDKTRQNVSDAMMSRVNTDIDRDRSTKEAQLIAQGIPKGSEAFNREMEQLDRKQTDARQQAEIAASGQAAQEFILRQGQDQQAFVNDMMSRGMSESEAINLFQNQTQGEMNKFATGLDARRQNISEALLNRQTPLNEVNAFRTGSQVSMPQFQAYGQQANVPGSNYNNAVNQQSQYDIAGYNADLAGRNALTSGLFGLGAAYLGA